MRSAPTFTGQVPRVREVLTAVLYNESNGDIAHVHRHVRFEGAPALSADAFEAEAQENAQTHGGHRDLKVLRVDLDALDLRPDIEYAVDQSAGRLVARRELDLRSVDPRPAKKRELFTAALVSATVAAAVFALLVALFLFDVTG